VHRRRLKTLRQCVRRLNRSRIDLLFIIAIPIEDLRQLGSAGLENVSL
jgi:hypothetical protein